MQLMNLDRPPEPAAGGETIRKEWGGGQKAPTSLSHGWWGLLLLLWGVWEEEEEEMGGGGRKGKHPWRAIGKDAGKEKREVESGVGLQGSTRDDEEEEGEEEVVEVTLCCDSSASLWGAPPLPAPATGHPGSALSAPYGRGRSVQCWGGCRRAAAVMAAAASRWEAQELRWERRRQRRGSEESRPSAALR